MAIYEKDIDMLKENLIHLPKHLDGKACVLELKEANYNWRQMEWWSFYFEYKAKILLASHFSFPGNRYGRVSFDLKGSINWDLKAKAIKSDSHSIILNDKSAMEQSVEEFGYHGEIILLCDVEYNDNDRSFQQWHTELKGGKSKYEKAREARTSVSRYRKTQAELADIVILIFNATDLDLLATHRQGRNSNGKSRRPKYELDLEKIDDFEHYVIKR